MTTPKNNLFAALTDQPTEEKESELSGYFPDFRELLAKNKKPNIPPDGEFFSKENLATFPGMDWMLHCNFNLYHCESRDLTVQEEQLNNLFELLISKAAVLKHEHLPDLLPTNYEKPIIAIDLETTGLNVNPYYGPEGSLSHEVDIVGLCLAVEKDDGYYLPVRHTEEDDILNWDPKLILNFMDRMHETFVNIYHNAKYDKEVSSLNGCTALSPYPGFFDVMILDYLYDNNIKTHGLKALSERHLGKKMIHINELFAKSNVISSHVKVAKAKKGEEDDHIEFTRLPATNAAIYGASDAMQTLELFEFYLTLSSDKNPFRQIKPIAIDHKVVDMLRNMLRPGHPCDVDYFYYAMKDTLLRIKALYVGISEYLVSSLGPQYADFNVDSPKQLSTLIFEVLKVPLLPGMEKGKNGSYSTAEEILETLQEKNPEVVFLEYVVTLRKLKNFISKFALKAIKNSFVDYLQPYARVRIGFNQVVAPTGRVTSSCNKHMSGVKVTKTKAGKFNYALKIGDGTVGWNAQGFPGDSHNTTKTKKLKALPEAANIDLGNIYKDVEMDFIENVTTSKL